LIKWIKKIVNKMVIKKGNETSIRIAPWVKKSTLRIRNPLARLHNETIDFCEYLAPTEKEH